MTEEREVEARVQKRRWFAWVWVVPIVAAAIVIWLASRALADRGPMITIEFKAAEGLLQSDARGDDAVIFQDDAIESLREGIGHTIAKRGTAGQFVGGEAGLAADLPRLVEEARVGHLMHQAESDEGGGMGVHDAAQFGPAGADLLVDGKLVILSEPGELIIGEASSAGFKPLLRQHVLPGRCWVQPTVANGRIFCRNNTGEMVALARLPDRNAR